jgi:hypothetical protein
MTISMNNAHSNARDALAEIRTDAVAMVVLILF